MVKLLFLTPKTLEELAERAENGEKQIKLDYAHPRYHSEEEHKAKPVYIL